MTDKQELQRMDKRPNRGLGQNFLKDQSVVAKMLDAAEVKSSDTIVEIGPGLGALTYPLCSRAGRVIAIERDRELAEKIRNSTPKNLTVVTGDALQVDWTVTIKGSYKIAASIPYSITSPLIRKIFSLGNIPARTVLLVQKEVAKRLTAKPGSSDRGWLTLLVEARSDARIIATVPPGCFYPAPKVDSAIISLTPRENRLGEIFWPAVEAGFRHKRQTLANALSDLNIGKDKSRKLLGAASLSSMARAQELSFEKWEELSRLVEKEMSR